MSEKKNENAQKETKPEKVKPKAKPTSFDSPVGCLKEKVLRAGECAGRGVTVKRWKQFPNFICECGYATLTVPDKVYQAAKKAGLV